MNDRKELLSNLINFERPLKSIMKRLRDFGWDSENELLEVTNAHIVNALQEYLNRKVSGYEIEEWANSIEGREDLKMKEEIKEVIYILANPCLTETLSQQVVIKLIGRLKNIKKS